MVSAICCFIYLLASACACKLYLDKEILRFSLHKNSGQVVRDLSGNNNHGMNGDTLESTNHDVTWTDRGAYFKKNQHISLGDPLVSESTVLLSRNFTLVTWVYILDNNGYIFGSQNEVRINYKRDALVNKYDHSTEEVAVPEGLKSKYYSDKWGMYSLMVTYFPTYVIVQMARNNHLYDERTVMTFWEDSEEIVHYIGKRSENLKGFIYEFTIYDEPLPPSVFASETLFSSVTSLCDGFPTGLGECISVVEDPEKNSDNQVCQCNGNSCRSDPYDCIECECNLNCSTTSPYLCIDFETEFCSPYTFNNSTLVCNNSSCSDGFFEDQSSSACYASCPLGFFGNSLTRKCEECDSSCSECEGTSSYCLSCQAPNSSPSGGTCMCSAGFFTESSSPLKCCSKTCTSCGEDLSCLGCIENAFLENGNCVCNSGYFLNSNFECEKCGPYCSECEEAGCLQCEDNMVLENKECVHKDESLGYFYILAELKDNSWVELKSEEKVNLTTDQVSLEVRPYNHTLVFSLNSEDNLAFNLEFKILEDFLEGEYILDLKFAEGILSFNNNLLQTQNFSFPLEFSIDRSYSTQEVVSIIGILSSLFTSFVAMVTLDEPTALWTIARTAQYISYLPILDIVLSRSFYMFLRTYNTAIFIPNLGVEYIDRTESKAPERFQTFGLLNKEFEDTNLMRNGSRFFMVFAVILLIHILVCVMSYVFPCNSLKERREVLRRKILGCLIRLWIFLSLDFLIYSSVTLYSDDPGFLSNIIMNLMFMIGNASPLVLYLLILKNEELIKSNDQKTMNYLDSLIIGIELDSRIGMFREVFMGIRNLVYVYTLSWMFEYPIGFCVIQLVVSAFFFVIMIRCKMFKTRLFLIINLLSETCLSVLFIGLIIIKTLDSEEERMAVEYTIEAICVGFILFATFAAIATSVIKKCTRRKRGDNTIIPGQVRPFDEEKYQNDSFQRKPSFFEHRIDLNANTIRR